jgi:hypothetical protein
MCGVVDENVSRVYAEALNDGSVLAHVLALAVDGATVALVEDDGKAAEAVGDELVEDDRLVVEVVPVVPSSELVEAQMNRRPGEDLNLKLERYPELLEFPGHMELHPPVEFLKPLEPARLMEVVLQMAASRATTSLPELFHSHRSDVLEIADYFAQFLHRTNWLEV